MIRIDRLPLPAAVLAVLNAETGEAISFYQPAPQADGSPTPVVGDFDFKAYKTEGVVDALNDAFGGKCAYCESPMHAVHPTDVEHYRPKGAVLIGRRKVKPAYYWLAAEWSNLLPSCIYCNRAHKHLIDGVRKTQGKGMRFPLRDEARRVGHPSHPIAAEEPLLLNPCGDRDPREHLRFTADGRVEARSVGGAPLVGETTIDGFALLRRGLVEARREHALRVLADLQLIGALTSRAQYDHAIRYEQAQRARCFEEYLALRTRYRALTMDLTDQVEPGFLAELPNIISDLLTMRPPPPAPLAPRVRLADAFSKIRRELARSQGMG